MRISKKPPTAMPTMPPTGMLTLLAPPPPSLLGPPVVVGVEVDGVDVAEPVVGTSSPEYVVYTCSCKGVGAHPKPVNVLTSSQKRV